MFTTKSISLFALVLFLSASFLFGHPRPFPQNVDCPFDGLLEFYKNKRRDNAYNLMGQRVTCGGIGHPGSATDGDRDVAFALLVACYQWRGSYLDEAETSWHSLKDIILLRAEMSTS